MPKKHYTKKQICEAIAYWKKQLKRMDEASGSIPFETGNAIVERTIDGLSKTLYRSKVVKFNDIDAEYAADDRAVYIANIGRRNQPGDILVVFKDFNTGNRKDVVLEVKSGQTSSLFSFTYKTGLERGELSLKSNAQKQYEAQYENEFKEIRQNMSDFMAVYNFVNAKSQEDLDEVFRKVTSIEQPMYAIDTQNLDVQNFNKTLKYVSTFTKLPNTLSTKYGKTPADAYDKYGNVDYERAFKNNKTLRAIMTDLIMKVKKLLRNGGTGIAFCSPFTVDINEIKYHFKNCSYIRIGPYMYSVNGSNPLKLTKKKHPIKSIDDDFNAAKMTVYLRKPTAKSSKFRIICSLYNLHMNDGYEISFDDLAYYPDKQYALVGVSMHQALNNFKLKDTREISQLVLYIRRQHEQDIHKKQITEAIAYWEKQLEKIDESAGGYAVYSIDDAIDALEDAKKAHGDIEVKIRSFNDNSPVYDDIVKIETAVDPATNKKILFIAQFNGTDIKKYKEAIAMKKKKYTKKQITEAIAYWKKQLNEADGEDSSKFATRKDFMDAFGNQKIKEEANAYAEKNSWINAIAFSYNVFRSAMDTCKALHAHEKDNKKKEAISEMFKNCRDISDSMTDMVGNIADNELLPKSGSGESK